MECSNVVVGARGARLQPRALTLGKAHAGRLIECDIAFNSGHGEFNRKPPLLLEKVMAHEFGHAIGLTHSTQCGDVMTLAADCPGVPADQLPQVPTTHDLERCQAVYGGTSPREFVPPRTEERPVGKECVSTRRSRGSPDP